ncbi:MAG: DNA polymerase I [Bacteroidota bacterium]|nr:DNA polymerase I [Rhodothermia bacterium]MCS7154817.1 DNA polymerase I [Bacteroidota bacterium]MDW8137611.1 DNA polymerase I [Bacteroidota bacterium]MDW8285435.1 DNA polymerase I [Bacteroidota bacterium]
MHATRERLFLLDGMALAYRAHFAFISRPLLTSYGLNTSAVYGFALALLKLLEEEKPEYLAVVFDTAAPTFRKQLYEAYKANRPPIPPELADGLPYIKELVHAFNIPSLEIPGYEADDVIGTLAWDARAAQAEVYLVTPDKDFIQLLNHRVYLYKPARRGDSFELVTADQIRQELGIEPHQYVDVLALMGDSTDNVPGVPGIGEKTALELVRRYGSLEGIYEHLHELKGRIRENLERHRDQAFLSRQLATIKTDVELELDWHRLRVSQPHRERLEALFRKLEFGTLLARLRPASQAEPLQGALFEKPMSSVSAKPGLRDLTTEGADYAAIPMSSALEALWRQLEGARQLAVDTETTGLDALEADLVGLSLSDRPRFGRYVPIPLPDGTPASVVLKGLSTLWGDPDRQWVGHNLKYDLLVLRRAGLAEPAGRLFDTMLAHYLLEPEAPHDLDTLAQSLLHYRTVPIEDLIGRRGPEQRSMREVPLERIAPYACEDADVALQLSRFLERRLREEGLDHIAERIEFPLIPVLAEMEWTGVKIDPEVLAEIGAQIDRELADLEARIYEAAGCVFTIQSPKQLAEVLFKRLGLKPRGRTPTGQWSTSERVLEELAMEHRLPGLILDYRSLAKLKSTYVEALPKLIRPQTGRVHTSFNQTTTATGRLSSSNPNLQNIPVRSELGREIRRAFVPEPGWWLLSADYSQIELRVIAALSQDTTLIEAFEEGDDIHTHTAMRVFQVPREAVSPEMRRKAKEVNFGIPYGVSAFGLAQRLRIPVEEARRIIDEYFRQFPRVNQYIQQTLEKARQLGYVETLLGRRRYVPGIYDRNPNVRSAAERMAINMPIQGTAADMIKLAMVDLHRLFRERGYRTRMILQVHDELLFEVPEEELEPVRELVRQTMEQALPLGVPIQVEIGVGKNWLDAH